MPKILILSDPTKYQHHSSLSQIIQSFLLGIGHETIVLNINTYSRDHECLNHIKELQPDVLITLDLSGFRFRTQTGEIALNMLPTKNLNLIWGKRPEYDTLLSKKLSLSMLFYDVSGVNNDLDQIYPYLLYYNITKNISTNDINATEISTLFTDIWSNFITNSLLV